METELENLVVRLTGEASDYLRMLTQAQQETQNVTNKVEASAKRIEELGTGLKTFASTVASSLGIIGLSIGLTSAMGKFNQMEEGMIRLSAAITANDGNVQAATANYMRLSDEITKSTLVTKGEVLGLARRAEMQGLAGTSAERLIRFSIGFAQANEISAESAMTLGIALERGNVQMLRRIPAFRGMTDANAIMAKAQKMANDGMIVANQLSETNAGKLQKLQRAFAGITKEIGGIVSGVLTPFIDKARQMVEWFNGLDKVVRSTIATALVIVGIIPVVTAMWGPLTTALGTVTTAFKVARTAMALLFTGSGWGAVLILIGLAILFVVEKMGGWQKAWEAVSAGATVVWNAIQEGVKTVWPALQALWAFIVDAWENVLGPIVGFVISLWLVQFYVWRDVWTSVWKALFGDNEVSWQQIGDTIKEWFLKAEFGLKNWKVLWSMAWTGIQYVSTKFMLDFIHGWTVTLPESIDIFVTQATDLFTNFLNLSTTIVGNLVGNIVRLITSIPGLISGSISWDEVWRPLTEGFEQQASEIPELTQREMSAAERALVTEWRDTGEHLNGSWEEFRARRLAEMARETDAAQDADDRDRDITNAKKERHEKLNQALSGSAEALARVQEFQDRMAGARDEAQNRPGSIPPAPPDRPNANPLGNLGNVFGGLTGQAQAMWSAIKEFAIDAWDSIKYFAIGVWNSTLDTATDVVLTLMRFFGDVAENWTTFWETLPGAVARVWGDIQDSAVMMFNRILDVGQLAWVEIKFFVLRLFTEVLNSPLIRRLTGVTNEEAVANIAGIAQQRQAALNEAVAKNTERARELVGGRQARQDAQAADDLETARTRVARREAMQRERDEEDAGIEMIRIARDRQLRQEQEAARLARRPADRLIDLSELEEGTDRTNEILERIANQLNNPLQPLGL